MTDLRIFDPTKVRAIVEAKDAEITRLRAEVERLSADTRRLDWLASNPRHHLDCEVLKFGRPGKWRVWKLRGKYEAKTLGEGDTPRAAIDASIDVRGGAPTQSASEASPE
jgi:hypothetical protein